ncbi:MAG: type II toxin-antitoxin system VapC family toxin [Terracidiphilus sp.]|jgi:PIN domain nuclease of toxin-antitoxin system
MIAYLDTHTAMRIADGRPRVGRDAAQLIQRAELLISPMVLVELEYLYEIGRLTLAAKDILRKLEHELGLRLCDLPFADLARAALDEKWTRDPFDRIIVAQARLNGLAPLISSDEEIAEHYPRTVW